MNAIDDQMRLAYSKKRKKLDQIEFEKKMAEKKEPPEEEEPKEEANANVHLQE